MNYRQTLMHFIFELAKFERNNGDVETIKYEHYATNQPLIGIGTYLDQCLGLSNEDFIFAAKSGTIKSKISFCKKAIAIMEDSEFEWSLTEELENLCFEIFKHIKECNQVSNVQSISN